MSASPGATTRFRGDHRIVSPLAGQSRPALGAGALVALVVSAVLAAPAGAAVLSGVQTGTAVSTANGTLAVPIAAVDPARSFLFFETRHDSNRPVGSMVRGRLAGPTTLEFIRVTNEATPAPISIQWYVAEFSSGVSVQRGEVEQTNTTIDVPITAVGGVDQAFVTWSKTVVANDQNNMGTDDAVLGELTSTTNLQLRVDTLRTGMWISWQVIEFTDPADIRVQKGTTSLLSGALSVDVTLPVAVDVSSTFVLVGYLTSGSGNDIGARMLRARLIDATTIRIDRSIAGNNDDIEEIVWQAVELRDGSEVLRGNASFATGVSQTLVSLGGRTVDPSGAVAFASVQPVGGQNMGASPYAADDIVGVCAVTMDLAPTFVTMDRDNTASTCDVGWFVVQFAPTATTAVELAELVATGSDGSVELEWETGSEMNNLGFHLYRSTSESGPWERITSSLIPGLGSSPEGARYGYRDTGLVNGIPCFYLLEDVETTGRTERHGPVSATPEPGVPAPVETEEADPEPDEAGDVDEAAGTWLRFGDPEATSLRVAERGREHVVVELRTGGFWAHPDSEGGVWLSIPGFEERTEPGAPALPVRQAWVEAVAGRKVRLASVVGRDVVAFDGLRPAVAGEPELWEAADGTLHPGVRRRPGGRAFRAAGLHPEEAAQILGTAFQGDVKKVQLELAPLRWDRSAGRLLLARRLRLKLVFAGWEKGEQAFGGARGRARRGGKGRGAEGVVARFAVEESGLYRVPFEEVPGIHGRGLRSSELFLSHRGEAVAFHVEPEGRRFGPGSILFFESVGGDLNPYGKAAVYELALRTGGVRMPIDSAAPAGGLTPHYWQRDELEVNRLYQPTLFSAPDRWLWDYISSRQTKSYTFPMSGLASSAEPGRLELWLQGGSDYSADPDHHVRVSVNGHAVAEASWDGKKPHALEATLAPGLLREGNNHLEITNVGDTRASYSLVILDRFAVTCSRVPVARAGELTGRFPDRGTATVAGVAPGAFVLDVTEATPHWLVGASATPSGVSFAVEAGREYRVVSPEALRRPVVRAATPGALRNETHRADYLVVGPRAFLEAASPLLEHRRGQGLEPLAVAVEDVYDEFGFGEESPEALRDFITHAYHHWLLGPRYVLLLGDATYDLKGYLNTGLANQVPPYMVRDPYMWTVSDPAYAAVNGEDLLPDVALGRLPALTVDEARILVSKVVAWESSGFDLSGRAVLVADNSDRAGDFEGDAEQLARTLLSGRNPERLYLSRLGAGTRGAILDSFDRGSSLYSYIGHGSIPIWASENVFNIRDVPNLGPQDEQPLLLTMNCLNGYFTLPTGMNSLAEELLKAEGRGVIGALSPSSLSRHHAARVYHEAFVSEIVSGRHQRLGDALMAAQAAYLESGASPGLLAVYQLLADPALSIR